MRCAQGREPGTLRRRRAAMLVALAGPLVAAGCGQGAGHPALATTTVAATTTTTSAPVSSKLEVIGVRAGVLQPPFYPKVVVTSVTCGATPIKGRFVRLDLPAGAAGTPAHSALTEPTAVIVVPGEATLVDKSNKVLYEEKMPSIATATQGGFVLTMESTAGTSADGLAVQSGALQVNGGYTCPASDVAYPGT